jgi:methionyl-tRNA formyltransferase
LSTPRLGFAGTPAFAATILEALILGNRAPSAVYTQPDRPVGRGRRIQPGPVKQLAVAHDIPVLQPPHLRGPDAAAALATLDLDVLVVAAYGLLLPPAILRTPRLGCINVHASLLPRWRGAAPVERALMAGDTRTGVSIMQMDRGLDTGPVYLMHACEISPTTTGVALEHELARLGAAALLACIDDLPSLHPVPQAETGATYANKLTIEDARIDWSASAATVDRQIRALSGRLPAFTFSGAVRLQILDAAPDTDAASQARPGTVLAGDTRAGLRVACGTGTLQIRRLQVNRGKGLPLRAAEALNGFPDLLRSGQVFHAEPR